MHEPKFPKQQTVKKSRKRIKQQSSKRANAEKNRKPLNNPQCWVSGLPTDLDKHEIFGGSNRQTSMKWDMVVYLNRHWHDKMDNDPALRLLLQRWGQRKFLKLNPKIDFIAQFGKNYLEVEWEGFINAEVLREISERHWHDEDLQTTVCEYRQSVSERLKEKIS